jgi:hypothetical protein
LFRRFTNFRIRAANEPSTSISPAFKFSIKYLLVLITIYSVVLGMTSQLQFQTNPSSSVFFGPAFFIEIVVFGGAVVSAALLPTTAIPLSILYGSVTRSAVAKLFIFWAVVTGTVVLFTLDMDDPSVLGFLLLAQFGSAIAGALAALLLRRAGLKLVQDRPRKITKPSSRQPISV